ncbi:DUF1684 domain-containing protein [Pedobacter cryoconitis]|uniref:DUF1684 domain-containing protein n=1 Tax=Pedobacter cryoconitis TaxID=188932 RepID=A0A7X0J7K2_9SPHI|nr:DUF1684 domain-containing protein [Pedobacter cryoconitis]MBB6501131.1 hypothetical protein [Pedobacter cryoconitis]
MKKYFLILLCVMSLKSFGQGYKAQIDLFRKNYMNEFLEDKNSPLKKDDLQFLRFFDADSTYKVTANATILSDASPFVIPVFTGKGTDYLRYAVLKFTLKGKELELTVYKNVALSKMPQYKDYLFLPFTDETNGVTTYGGGRYIDLREGDFNNGTLIIDFNKAYNPYCAFAGGYACPKPPDENHLLLAVEAGEKMFANEKKH